AQIAAESGSSGGDHDDPSEMELVFGIRHKTSQQERDFAGNGNAGALPEQGQSHGPVTVVGDEGAEKVRNMHKWIKEVLSSQFSVLRAACLAKNWELRTRVTFEKIDQ